MYEGIRKITETRAPTVKIVKDRNGLILNGDKEVKNRWKEYFEELYNDPNTVDRTVLSHIPETREEDNKPEFMLYEFRAAIDKIKKNNLHE